MRRAFASPSGHSRLYSERRQRLSRQAVTLTYLLSAALATVGCSESNVPSATGDAIVTARAVDRGTQEANLARTDTEPQQAISSRPTLLNHDQNFDSLSLNSSKHLARNEQEYQLQTVRYDEIIQAAHTGKRRRRLFAPPALTPERSPIDSSPGVTGPTVAQPLKTNAPQADASRTWESRSQAWKPSSKNGPAQSTIPQLEESSLLKAPATENSTASPVLLYSPTDNRGTQNPPTQTPASDEYPVRARPFPTPGIPEYGVIPKAPSSQGLTELNAPLLGVSSGDAYSVPERLPVPEVAQPQPGQVALEPLPPFDFQQQDQPSPLEDQLDLAQSVPGKPIQITLLPKVTEKPLSGLTSQNDLPDPINSRIPIAPNDLPPLSDESNPEISRAAPNLSLESIPLKSPSPLDHLDFKNDLNSDLQDSAADEPNNVLPARSPAMNAVADQAGRYVKRGFSLAQRGAYFSARSQFIRSLRTISQALDAQASTAVHSAALADGLRALDEAHDFMPRGSRLEADLDMRRVVASHRTEILAGEDLEEVSSLEAQRRYYTYAQQQLGQAVKGEPIGSMALYGLARVHTALGGQSADGEVSADLRSMSLHQAALLAHPRNHLAANELGVLLARYQQNDQSLSFLQYSVRLSSEAETYHNLSKLHKRLGQTDLAKQAEEAGIRTARAMAPQNGTSKPNSSVVWMPPGQFAQTADMQGNARSAGSLTSTAPAKGTPTGPAAPPTKTHDKPNAFGWLKWNPSKK